MCKGYPGILNVIYFDALMNIPIISIINTQLGIVKACCEFQGVEDLTIIYMFHIYCS